MTEWLTEVNLGRVMSTSGWVTFEVLIENSSHCPSKGRFTLDSMPGSIMQLGLHLFVNKQLDFGSKPLLLLNRLLKITDYLPTPTSKTFLFVCSWQRQVVKKFRRFIA